MHLIKLIKINLIIVYLFYLICISEGSFCNVLNKCVPCSETDCSCPYIKEILEKYLTLEDTNVLQNSICSPNHICCPIDLPEPPICGIYYSNINKIFGGEETALEEFPWTVLITGVKDGFKYQSCGGSLINKRYVITAAHCIKYQNKELNRIQVVNIKIESVRLGDWNKTSTIDCINGVCSEQAININVEKIIIHEKYKPGPGAPDDIALLRLAKDVIYSKYIQPICLPIDDELRNYLYSTPRSFIIVGWGKTEKSNYSSEIKLKATIPPYNQRKCQDLYLNNYIVNITNSQICAGGEEKVDACKGDSGGPLMFVNDKNQYDLKYYLAGIISFGPYPCAKNGTPGVYTRVGSYIDWILDKIEL